MISIYRYINDISLNGREYLLDEENQILKFTNEKQAFNFLSNGGVEAKDEEELEEYGIYFEIEEEAWAFIHPLIKCLWIHIILKKSTLKTYCHNLKPEE